MRLTSFALVAVLSGACWAVHGWIATMDTTYWSARSSVDYASVASYSAALMTLAVSIWRLRVVRTRAVRVGGTAAALGLCIAGIANIGEDWFGVGAFVIAYLPAIIIGTFALIPMGVGLAREARPRWIAVAPLVTFPGLVFLSHWYGSAILAATWIAAGALHSIGRLPLRRESPNAAEAGG